MHVLDLPAGAPVRFTATARPDRVLHRWDMQVLAADGGATRLTFGSRIGGRDVRQCVEIPPQDVDCRIEVVSSHKTKDGWAEDQASRDEDTPARLVIGFFDPAEPGAGPNDVLLSFEFRRADRQPEKEDPHGQGPEEIEPRSPQAETA